MDTKYSLSQCMSNCLSASRGIYRTSCKALRIMRNSHRLVGTDLSSCGTLQVALPRGVLQHTWAKYMSLNSIKMQRSLRAVVHILDTCPSMLCLNLLLGSFDATVKLWDLRYFFLLELCYHESYLIVIKAHRKVSPYKFLTKHAMPCRHSMSGLHSSCLVQ